MLSQRKSLLSSTKGSFGSDSKERRGSLNVSFATTTNFFPEILSTRSDSSPDGYGSSPQSRVPSKMRSMQQHGNESNR